MYKVASDRRQSALTRGRLSDWANGEEWQSVEQRFKQMKEGIHIIEKRILAASGEERKKLSAQKFAMQTEIAEFRKSMGLVKQAVRGFSEVFVELSREMLSKSQYEMLRNATTRECQRRQQEIDALPVPETAAHDAVGDRTAYQPGQR